MKTEQAKQVLTDLIRLAVSRDRRGEVVLRQQALRSIEDLSLPPEYVTAALRPHGLLPVYRGPQR